MAQSANDSGVGSKSKPGVVALTSDPNTLGGLGKRVTNLNPALAKPCLRILKVNKHKGLGMWLSV